jgi:hypothetical protein
MADGGALEDVVIEGFEAIAASVLEDWMANTTDNLTATYWHSSPHKRDQWILYDLGAEQTFPYVVLVLPAEFSCNIRTYALTYRVTVRASTALDRRRQRLRQSLHL